MLALTLCFLLQKLGVEIDAPLKGDIVSLASPNKAARFNKYSGVLEWKNACFLWVCDAISQCISTYIDTCSTKHIILSYSYPPECIHFVTQIGQRTDGLRLPEQISGGWKENDLVWGE